MKVSNLKPGMFAALFLCAALAMCSSAHALHLGGGIGAPPGMEVEWQSVSAGSGVCATGSGKAWVKDDLILISSGYSLIALRRRDGVHLWRCDLENELRFPPAVSRNNVLVNVNNFLIAIEKTGGNIRWKLPTNYIMSNEPLLIDPVQYPAEYTNQWANLELIFVAGWDSRIHSHWSRGKMASFFRGVNTANDFLAPNFDLSNNFTKANKGAAITVFPFKIRDNMIYYTADNNYIMNFTRDGEDREGYYMMGQPTTEITLTPTSLYVGSQDFSVYCLDRLTMRKKWNFAAGQLSHGVIFADEAATPLVYVPLASGQIQALRVSAARAAKKGEFETPERMSEFWKIPGNGTVTAGPLFAYIGSGKVGDHAYKSVTAIDKSTGRPAWTMSSAEQYLEYHNNWSNSNSAARIYALNSDGAITSYKEIKRETGILVAKMPVDVVPETPTIKIIKKPEDPATDPVKVEVKVDAKVDAEVKVEVKKEEAVKEEPKK